MVGTMVGFFVGILDGLLVFIFVGCSVNIILGISDRSFDGDEVGVEVVEILLAEVI